MRGMPLPHLLGGSASYSRSGRGTPTSREVSVTGKSRTGRTPSTGPDVPDTHAPPSLPMRDMTPVAGERERQLYGLRRALATLCSGWPCHPVAE